MHYFMTAVTLTSTKSEFDLFKMVIYASNFLALKA